MKHLSRFSKRAFACSKFCKSEEIPELMSHTRVMMRRPTAESLFEPTEEDRIFVEKKIQERKERAQSKDEEKAELRAYISKVLEDPKFRHLKLIKSKDQLSVEAELDEIKQAMQEGRLGIFKGGRAGGTSLLNYEKMNDKFYDFVTVEESPDKDYKVRIGKESFLKTAKQKTVSFPNKTLAHAVSAEWELQDDFVRPTTLQLTELQCRTQDVDDDALIQGDMITTILGYFEAEMICHREDINDKHYLAPRVKQVWDPIVAWYEKTYNISLRVFQGDTFPTDSVQHDAKKLFIEQIVPLLKQDTYQLVAFHAMTENLSSVIVAWAYFNGHLTADQALEAVQLNVREQTKSFGLVMGEHDVAFAEQKCKVSACKVFQLLGKYRASMI